jgi:uncharacterized alpha-E superfamily protein
MLSRVADCFYWMSRYLERAEHAARVIGVHQSLTLDDPTDTVGRALLESIDITAPTAPVTQADTTVTAAAAAGHIDPVYPAAVAHCVVQARENARQIREQISAEMWEQVNTMYLTVARRSRSQDAGGFMRGTIDGAHLFYGVTEATLSHGEGWHYMQLGRYIERAMTTASMLQLYFSDRAGPVERIEREGEYVERVGLLRACAAFEAYCRHYTADIRPERLAEFLLLNAEFPRSVRFAADRVDDSLRAIARALGRQANGRPERFGGRLRSSLNFGTIDEIIQDNVVQYLENVSKQCGQIHVALYQTYIAYPIETAIAR